MAALSYSGSQNHSGAEVETPTTRPTITPSALGALLDRIVGSSGFRRSFRLQRFLRYVTEEAVNSPGRPLKEIQVAMAVFDKDAGFEPRLDPIVRVEAGRLRLRLLEYYAERGEKESIIIEIPRGGYVPNFRVLAPPQQEPGANATENRVAYRLCLKGRYFWSKRTAADLAKAVDYFRRALAVDPSYATAYLGLADCYVVLGYFGFAPPGEVCPRAKAAAAAALDIDQNLSRLTPRSRAYPQYMIGTSVGPRPGSASDRHSTGIRVRSPIVWSFSAYLEPL
jgi:hypothetical protein